MSRSSVAHRPENPVRCFECRVWYVEDWTSGSSFIQSLPSLHLHERSHRFDFVPGILQPDVLVGRVLVVVVIRNRNRNRVSTRGPFHSPEWNATTHGGPLHHLSS